MGVIAPATLVTVLDSIASGKLIFDNAVGVLGTETNTVGKAATNDANTLAATNDAQVEADLMPYFKIRDDLLTSPSLYTALGVYNLFWALEKHTANSSQAGVIGLDTYMAANNLRASLHVVQVGIPLSPAQVMPPATDPMATFAVSGSGTGTYTHVQDIDTTQYGRAWLQAVVTSTIGGNAIQATVTGLQLDATTVVSKTVTIAANSSVGTAVNIGVLGTVADSYDYVTNIAISGGTAGDGFKVSSRVERVITATS